MASVRRSLQGVLGGVASCLLLLATSANATCWVCAWDVGVEQFYCASTENAGAADCTPISGDYCDLIGGANCNGHDHCQCYRYPVAILPKPGKQHARLSLGVMLLHGRDRAAQQRLLEVVPATISQFEINQEIVTPDVATRAIAALGSALQRESIELAGYSAITSRGLAVTRMLGVDHQGVLVDSRNAPMGQHVRVSQLASSVQVESSLEFELAPGKAALAQVRLGGETYACVVWSRQVEEPQGELRAAAAVHRQFIEAADSFESRRMVAIRSDVPDLRDLGFFGTSPRQRPWGELASFYH